MPRKKKRFARAQRFVKKYNLVLNVLVMILSLILPLIVGQEFVIIKTVHQINLDVVNAYAHSSVGLKFRVFATVTIQNASGTFILSGT
jgi:ABC-type microcin C transport system permease subunit YejE